MNPTNYQAALDAAIEESCRQWHVTREQVMGRFKMSNEAMARHCVSFAMRSIGMKFEAIGDIIGSRDHKTIVCGVKKAFDLMDTDEEFKRRAFAVRQAATSAHTPRPLSSPSEQIKTQPCAISGAANGIRQ